MDELIEDTFYKFAFSKLKTRYLAESEFKSLLKHIIYIKRLLKKYKDNPKNINVNLLINHFIILYNEFDHKSITEILFYQVNSIYYPQIKTVLLMLNKIKNEDIITVNALTMPVSEIQIDKELEKILKSIF